MKIETNNVMLSLLYHPAFQLSIIKTFLQVVGLATEPV